MPHRGLSQQVKRQIALATLAAAPTLQDISTELGLSPRTLQRGLEKEGMSFSAILDDLRKHEAIKSINAGTRDLKSLATALGFRQQSTLTRAMVRWTRCTPSRLLRPPQNAPN